MNSCSNVPESDGGLTLTPPRPIVSGRHARLVTFFPSQKNKGAIACESLLEASVCLLLEYLPWVAAYQAQPFTLRFSNPVLRYTPDFLAVLDSGRKVLIEVKSESGSRNPKWRQRASILEQLCGRHGFDFYCIREHHFAPPIVLDNLRYLYHRGFDSSDVSSLKVIRVLQEIEHPTPIDYVVGKGVAQADIARALFHQCIKCNLRVPIDLRTKIWSIA